jgi:tetratricopeptide (TPR) repeat protein
MHFGGSMVQRVRTFRIAPAGERPSASGWNVARWTGGSSHRPFDGRSIMGVCPAVWRKRLVAIGLAAVAGLGFCAASGGQEPPAQLRPLQIEDRPEPQPSAGLSEPQRNKAEALVLFATARMRQQQGDEEEALRLYQRAARLDPDSYAILKEIVPLAFKLRRPEEAIRYALRSVKLRPSDPRLLRGLADYLTERGDIAGALQLYEKLLAAETPEERKTSEHVLLKMVTGRLYHLNAQHAEAAAAFAEVLHALEHAQEYGIRSELRGALLGDAAQTYTMFGESFLAAGKIKEAEAAFRTAYEVSRDKASLAYRLATVHAARDELDKAREQLQAYFDAQGQSEGAAPYKLLGEVLTRQGRGEQYLQHLRQLRQQDARNPALTLFVAERLRDDKQFADAATMYQELIDQAAADARAEQDQRLQALVEDAYVGLVACRVQLQQPAELLQALGRYAESRGDLETLGQAFNELVKDRPLLKSIVAEAHREHQAGRLTYGGRLAAALVAIEAEDFAAAKQFFDLALESRPQSSPQLLLMWGLGLLVKDQPAQAVQVFQRAIDEKAVPAGNPAFHYYLAGALELAGRTDDALQVARHAVSLNEDSPRLHARVAWILYHAGRYDEATKAYEALLQRFDGEHGNSEVRQTMRDARLVLSHLYVLKNDLPKAEEWVEQVLDEFPDDPTANNDLGYLWADQGKNLLRALEMIRKAVAAEPDNPAFLDSLGWVYYRLQQYEEAVKYLQRAVELDESPDGVILDHLGDALRAVRRLDEARDTYQRALKAYDPQRDADKIEATRKKLEALGSARDP